jgi:F-type H+-transporting ATPase subunit b
MEELSILQKTIAMMLTQGVCFAIFLWILVKYAVGPVKSVLDERREKIQNEFDRISELEEKFTKLQAEYEDKMEHIEDQAHEKVQEAITEGRRIATEITEQAREEAKGILERSKRSIDIEIDKAKVELKDEIIAMTIGATEKLINEKLDEQKDKELVGSFIASLESSKNGDAS